MTNIQRLARSLAAQGRNGDTELVHMMPAELAILERMTGRKATTNPVTGAKEGFAFLIPLLASLISSIGGAVANKVLSPKPKAPDETASRKAIDARDEKARQNMYIPLSVISQQPLQQQPGFIHGVGPEQMQIKRTPFGYVPPASQTGVPPGFAEGGQIPEQEGAEELIHEAMEALNGTSETPEMAIQRFVEVFGQDALQQLMGMAQPQQQQGMARGGHLKGPGAGQDDLMRARVRGGQQIALSGDEYVVPADATSMLGDGSSDQGGRVLDAMVARIRAQKTGSTQQAPKLNLRQVLPA